MDSKTDENSFSRGRITRLGLPHPRYHALAGWQRLVDLTSSARSRRVPCRAEQPTVGIAADDTSRAAAVTASSAAQVERPSDESTVAAALAMALEEAGPAELSSLDVNLREYLVAVVCDVRLRRRAPCTRREAVGKLQRNGGRKPKFPVHIGSFTWAPCLTRTVLTLRLSPFFPPSLAELGHTAHMSPLHDARTRAQDPNEREATLEEMLGPGLMELASDSQLAAICR
jgi:hypothetical protein